MSNVLSISKVSIKNIVKRYHQLVFIKNKTNEGGFRIKNILSGNLVALPTRVGLTEESIVNLCEVINIKTANLQKHLSQLEALQQRDIFEINTKIMERDFNDEFVDLAKMVQIREHLISETKMEINYNRTEG